MHTGQDVGNSNHAVPTSQPLKKKKGSSVSWEGTTVLLAHFTIMPTCLNRQVLCGHVWEQQQDRFRKGEELLWVDLLLVRGQNLRLLSDSAPALQHQGLFIRFCFK